MQLQFNITATRTQPAWLDVSDLARGVGFTTTVEISLALHAALRPRIRADEPSYDQRLYDALWLAYHALARNARPDCCFRFDFLREDTGNADHLRLHVTARAQLMQLDLCPHAREAPHGDLSRPM
jgi:hypothetical protein